MLVKDIAGRAFRGEPRAAVGARGDDTVARNAEVIEQRGAQLSESKVEGAAVWTKLCTTHVKLTQISGARHRTWSSCGASSSTSVTVEGTAADVALLNARHFSCVSELSDAQKATSIHAGRG